MPTKRSDFFALVIGINEYKEHKDVFPDLSGCVADAESFKKYFQEDLGVPEVNITYLNNTEATRSKILQGFSDLATDSRIDHGSAICIFYAGHGAFIKAPPEWEAGGRKGKIQAIVPHDYSENHNSPVPSIMDRELSKLLNDICETKGNNVTVIFDCCHSTSGTRFMSDIIEDYGRVRCATRDLSYDIHALTDDTFPNSERSSTNIISLGQIGLQSHILLAACESTKRAYETKDGRGRFSTALLSLFNKTEIDNLRYSDILKNLDDLPGQNPQCEGNHQDRYIFSTASPRKNKAFALHVAEGDIVTLDGGIAHGITAGAEFDVFSRGSNSDSSLGQFVVNTPNLYNSIGTMISGASTLTPGKQYFAEQKKCGERNALRIYTDSSLAEQLYMHLQTTKPTFSNFDIVQIEKEAQIVIEREDEGRARLRVIDPSLDKRRKTAEGYPCSMKDLGAVLEGVSFYHWTRDDDCKNVLLRQSVINDVEVEFYRLRYNGRRADTLFSVDSSNLCETKDGRKAVDLTIADNSEIYYGIKLINNSSYDLFPAIFYFDSDDLSICPYYEHHQTGPVQKPEAPLPCKGSHRPGTLTIGYGSGGAHPFSFSVPADQDYDVDRDPHLQGSPFEMTARADSKRVSDDSQGLVSGVIDIRVIQRRENSVHAGTAKLST